MVKIDFRKIIAFGNGGYVVTLPRNWIQKHNLKKGDLLAIDEGSGQLTFSASHDEQKKEEKTIIIEARDKKLSRLKTEIVSAYLNNYNTIEIISKSVLANSSEIKNILRDLAGMEIMEQTSTRIVAKDLINVFDISVEHITRRMDNIIRGMMDDCGKCIEGEDHYESIFQRDNDVNRLYYLATRVSKNALKNPFIARAYKKDPFELSSDQLILDRLEKIADSLKRIARYLKEARISRATEKGIRNLYDDINKAYYDVMKAYYTKNRDAAFTIEVSNKQLNHNSAVFLEKNTGCSLNISLIVKNKGKNKIQPNTCMQVSKVVENLKGITSSIKSIARTILKLTD